MKKLNKNGFALSTLIYGIFIMFIFLIGILIVTIETSFRINTGKVNAIGEITYSDEENGSNIDDSGANPPDISDGLVPIKYNGTNWVVTTKDDKEWYNYSKQIWANAAILKESKSKNDVLKVPDGDTITEEDSDVYAMFVWVPRFEYTIGCLNSDTDCFGYRMMDDSDKNLGDPTAEFPGAIDIKFVSADKEKKEPVFDNGIYPTYKYTASNTRESVIDHWYTHPAFTFNDKELSGIWVGKFETSVDSKSTCYTSESKDNCNNTNQSPRILPNVISLKYQTVYNQFMTAQKFSKAGNIYGIDNTKIDAHMMKNSEWGAVAYLSQSIYGKYGNGFYDETNKEIYKNDSSSYYTGRSQGKPSTSGYSSSGTYKYDDVSTTDGTKEANKGTGASTTGNIYGIYDMSGGAAEYVMGYFENAISGTSYPWGSTSGGDFAGFTAETKPENKYFNGYQNYTIFEKTKEVVGHALYETGGWYKDFANELLATLPWVCRGGSCESSFGAGVFASSYYNGNSDYDISFRSVLTNIS